MKSKTFFCLDHQGKAGAFVAALESSGWVSVHDFQNAAICLVDSDVTPSRRKKLEAMVDAGCQVFIYPHAARPNLFYDFPGWDAFPGTTAQFVVTETHKKVLEVIGYKRPLFPVGWSYCQLRLFRPSTQISNVLFMPIHANSNGWLSDIDKSLNQWTLEKLLKVRKEHSFELTVRYLDSLESCGLDKCVGVEYCEGSADQSTVQIDCADLVVSTQTPAYLSVARGVPTLMFGEQIPPRIGWTDEMFQFSPNWCSYRDLIRYPLDILSDRDTWGLMERAAKGSPWVDAWRDNLIGNSFNSKKFLAIVERCLEENKCPLPAV